MTSCQRKMPYEILPRNRGTGLPSTRLDRGSTGRVWGGLVCAGLASAGWNATGATSATATTVNRASRSSALHGVRMLMNSGPAAGVQAMANAQPEMRKHMPGDDATARQNWLAGPPPPGSAAAHAETTAMAMPAANQISSGGRVALNQNSARG
jgi:hypothetical protein